MLRKRLPTFFSTTIIWVAILVGFWLRAFRLDFQPLWFDEGYSLYFANSDLLTTAALTAADIHPPFYYYLLHIWMGLAGPSDVSVRLLSVFVGTLSIPLIYAFGKRIFDKNLAVLMALLLSLSPLHIYYAQEVRMYALVTFLVLLSTWAFVSVAGIGLIGAGRTEPAAPTGNLAMWVAYVVAESLSLYTQYYAAFVPLAHFAFLLLRRRNPPRLWGDWLAAQVVVFITFLPWAVYAGLQLTSYVGRKVTYENYAPQGFLDFFWRLSIAFGEGTERPDSWQWVAVPVLLIVAVGAAGWLQSRRRESHPALAADGPASSPSALTRDGVLLCLIILGVSGLAGWLVNQRLPFNPPRWERLYLFGLPYFVVLMALGIWWLGKLRAAFAWLSLSICLAAAIPPLYAFYTTPRYEDDYRPLVRAASAMGRPEDLVVAVYPWQIGFFQSYYRGAWPSFVLMQGEQWDDESYRAARLEDLGRSHERIWVPAYQALGGIFEGWVESYLATRFFPALNEWYANTRLLLFHTGGNPDLARKEADFERLVQLANYGTSAKPVEAGSGAVDVVLLWQVQKSLSGRLVAKLRLYDEAGHTFAQRDSALQAGLRPAETWMAGESIEDHHALLVPAGTPPGEYDLGLSLTFGGNALNLIEADGNPHGQELVLGKVRVSRSSFPPRPDSLPIQTRRVADLGDGIEILGYSMGSAAVKPGETVLVNVFWQAKRPPQAEHQAVFRLVDGNGKVVSEQRKPVGQRYPPRQWTTGEAIREQFDFAIPAAVVNGAHVLRLSLDGSTSSVRLDDIRVEGRERFFSPPDVPHRLTNRFGEAITLLGFEIGGQVVSAGDSAKLGRIRAGDSFSLKLIWRVDKEVGRNLKVFTHVVESGSRIWGQRDSVPGQGTMPTSAWVEGEYIEDRYEIGLKPDTPAGTLEIVVGLYDPLTGERLPAFDAAGRPAGDKAVLGALEVVR